MNSEQNKRWPVWKLSILLYPFAASAVAINLFMLGLLGQAVGFAALSPITSLVLSIGLGIPATWAAGIWVYYLISKAEGD